MHAGKFLSLTARHRVVKAAVVVQRSVQEMVQTVTRAALRLCTVASSESDSTRASPMSNRPDSKPPAAVRYLAAGAHIGFWAGAIPLHVARQTYDLDDYLGPLLGLLALFAFAPAAAALLAARRSAWRWFLAPHARAALIVHAAAAIAALTVAILDPPLWELPGAVTATLWTLASVTLSYWFVLPFGAAFRARDGAPAWYPLLGRVTATHAPSQPVAASSD